VTQARIQRLPSDPNLSYFHTVDKGGRFAAWEQPTIFSEELRAAFKALREPI